MSAFPPAFQLSQSSLQDFSECQRRFQLRYLNQQQWPAPVAEPLPELERADKLGRQFHRLVERYWMGLPAEGVPPELATWWKAFAQHPPAELPGDIRRPEVQVSATVLGRRVMAAFDLLAYEEGGRVMIVDWKTVHERPTRQRLAQRLQTILYPLLLVNCAERLLGYAVAPEAVTLMYWFTAAPAEPEYFPYSEASYASGMQRLDALFGELEARLTSATGADEVVWPLTDDVRKCKLCQFRSLCNRGREAGRVNDEEIVLTEHVGGENPVFGLDATVDDYVL